MRITALAMLTLTLAAGPVAAQQKQSENVDRTIPFSPGGTLKLKNFSGDVHVTGGAVSQVVIHAVRTASRDRLDHIKLDIQVNGSTINIEANQRESGWADKNNNVVDTKFDIEVPAETSLEIDAFSSDVVIKETVADIRAHTFSGNIDLDVALAGTTPDLTVETFSGDISAKMAAGASGRVSFNSFSGDLRSDLPLMVHTSSKRNISADLGGGTGGKLQFKTFSGDLKLVK
jgi:DUF4097 and DUF4098 domain-containing protein YvlB